MTGCMVDTSLTMPMILGNKLLRTAGNSALRDDELEDRIVPAKYQMASGIRRE